MPEVLTRVDPDERLSGRELDAEIHVRVMGFPLESKLVGDGASKETALRCEPENAAWRVRSEADKYWDRFSPDGSERVVIAPHYSESIEAAMAVVEKMAQLGWQIEMVNAHKLHTLVTDNSRIWYVRLINDENDLNNWSEERESLPEAISRAALKALEHKESE